jgi:hypothetical protein
MISLNRYTRTAIAALFVLLVLLTGAASAQERHILFVEDFDDLNNWKPLNFPKIEEHSTYTTASQGDERYLKAESKASASGLIYENEFNVYEFPKVRWRWKVENIYKNGDTKTKKGDDYPIRVYIIFKYDPEKAGLWEKITYNTAKLIYGEYPLHSSLNYIWANREHEESILTSPYTDRAKMIPLQQGKTRVGAWIVEEINILEDYQRAFGEAPPSATSIAIMNDSDNTGESSVSYVDYIEVYR